jgi:Mrp family chromosome partitioning ATPase
VVATVRPTAPIPDRARRSADHSTPPSIEGSADPYQLTYLYLSRDEPDPLLLTLTGDDASIVAVTAANLAALSAAAASRVLVIDTDTSRAPIAATFAIQAGPGFADIGRVATEWTGLTTHVQVGRDRTIAVIPSGVGSPPSAESVAAFIRETGPRFAREYDAILVVAPIDRVPNDANAPIASWAPDTLICARVGHTLLNTLAQQIDTLRGVGAHPIGVLLWNAPLPTRPTSRESGAARRPLPKQEKAPTAAR